MFKSVSFDIFNPPLFLGQS